MKKMNLFRMLLALAAIALTSGCASTRAQNPVDPLESYNRGMYQFNDTLDKAIARPIAKGYDAVVPEFGKMMVNNFFSNLDDIIVTANDLLQLKFAQAASDGSRVIFNSTFGIFGLLDVTSRLEKHNEDFGQTLGYWGVSSGPYIVLPILGPSTLRDGAALFVDSRPSKLRRVTHMRTRNQLYATKAISRRAQLLDQEKLLDEAAVDRYEFIRDAYLLRRKSLVSDGNLPRETYDDEGMDDEKNKQVPIPNTPSAQKSGTTNQPISAVTPAVQSTVVAQANPTSTNVYKVWVPQERP